MGEIDETKQGTPSEKEAPPSGKEEITPKETPQTYTQDQVDKTVDAALTKAGRDAKSFELKEKSLTERGEQLEQWRKDKEAAELEALKDNPEALDFYKERKTLKQEKADLAKEKAEHAEEIRIAKETQQESAIREIATEHKVDPVKLKNLSTKFNIEGKEQLAELAEEIASGKTADPSFDVDSGKTTGGKKDLSGMSPMELAREGYSKSK